MEERKRSSFYETPCIIQA